MAIVVDPDLLDRFSVIYNTSEQRISFYPVGSTIVVPSAVNPDGIRASGIASAAGLVFTDPTRTAASAFATCGVGIGDILCLFNGSNAGHYIIDAVTNASQLTVRAFTGFTGFVAGADAASNIFYTIRSDGGNEGSGSSLSADGATEQALYSFSKEEWRNDGFNGSILGSQSTVAASDDLIKHEFPFEPITAEQFELGGGVAHADWTWGLGPDTSNTTTNYVRTGGWADKEIGASTLREFSGIVTLGTLDSDAQVYFQQASATATPTDFVLTGAVNQPIKTFHASSGDQLNNRSFLKLFVRKKARSYAQSEIADIGVTTIQTIVNRFPLTHATDPSITALDGSIVGAAPFISGTIPDKSLTGSPLSVATTEAGGSILQGAATFLTDDVRPGDVVIVGGTGFAASLPFHIIEVPAEGVLVVSIADGDFVADATGDHTTRIQSLDIIASTVGDNIGIAASDAAATTATFTASTIDFNALGVIVGDFLVITGSTSGAGSTFLEGVHKITSLVDNSTLGIDTSAMFASSGSEDVNFPTTSSKNLDFRIQQPGMILQQRASVITESVSSPMTDLDFLDNSGSSTIVRTIGDWGADGVRKGDVIQITGTTLNNSCFTVASVTSATKLTITVSDGVQTEGPVASTAGASAVVTRHFARDIGGETFAFRWRLFGVGATLIDQFQFVQHQLRQTTDIDVGGQFVARGDITDLLMTFSTPTGVALNLFIDDLNLNDINNVTFRDACGKDRLFPFVSTVTLQFNTNLQGDADATFWVFFTNDDTGDNSGRDYGTKDAITVQDSALADVTGLVAAASSFTFDFDYTNNAQRGGGSEGTDAPVTVIAIGLNTAQFVITTGTITQAKGIVISLVSALERNYSNP